ncbi:uncharacterized protein LAESUDRAFT_760290 [Laetiporus sulphureus 93-53]|uniref:Uncharacterized protein n=1 Tax=Laetiporus sulphureus 93-53 TaxID=1314785 RepID=A0A165DQQ9_9APHY|nr:uncharacterized protein LAESUDRAFT_760290 [Laetiporus sulphureus 93-53]KZT05418.1 hypothetical protein LAESUDRAFT_760290 [Laetiporus sulphureus 93-53]
MDLEPQPPSSSASAGGSSSSSTELVHTDYTPKLTLAAVFLVIGHAERMHQRNTDLDDLHKQQPTPVLSPPPTTGPDLTAALQDLRSALDARLDALESRMATVAAPPSQVKAPPPSKPQVRGTPKKRSYAAAAAPSRPAPPVTTLNPPTPPKAPGPKHAPEPLRYVVRFAGPAPAHLLQTPPVQLVSDVNAALAAVLTALAAYPSSSGNIVLAFPATTSYCRIDEHLPTIRNALRLNPDHHISRNVKWSRVLLGNVSTRAAPGGAVHSTLALSDELVKNPALARLHLTQPPCWARRPEQIDGAHSSVVLGFEDLDGSILTTLLRTPLFAFGAPVTTSRWRDKPCL